MVNRLTIAFLLSLASASLEFLFQTFVTVEGSPYIYRAGILLSYFYGVSASVLTGLIIVWSSSHLLANPEQRTTWSSIIFAMGAVNISSLTLDTVYLNYYGWVYFLFLTAPVLALLGGSLGLIGVRPKRVHQPT